LNKVVPQVKLEESKFLKFLYNYLLSIRHKMWTKSGIECKFLYIIKGFKQLYLLLIIL
jgi:hypothetical protein